MVQCNALFYFKNLLTHSKASIVKVGCKTCLTLIFNLLWWRLTDMMKLKQCTLFLLQEATWAISNVTAGPKEQIQVKRKYHNLWMHQAKWLYLLHRYLLPKNGVHLIFFFYCGIGTCKKWTVTIVSRETNPSLYKCTSFKC